MTTAEYPMSRYEDKDYAEALTRAERFVDDTTLLRMMRLRFPIANPEIGGLNSDTIKQVHLADAQLEDWSHVEDDGSCWQGLVDIAFRFPDESLAIRFRATKRWEVYRSW